MRSIHASIVSIGDELLFGEIQDENAPFISSSMRELGIEIKRVIITGDSKEGIKREIERCLKDSHIVVGTGGLGPTEDDKTRFAVSELVEKPLILHRETLKRIKTYLEKAGMRKTVGAKVQAMVPEGAKVIENPVGTAPGFAIEKEGKSLIFLPGVPDEVKSMWESVKKIISQRYGLKPTYSKTIHTCGLSESSVNERLKDLWNRGRIGLTVGKLGVKIRIVSESEKELKELSEEIKKRVGSSFVGEDTRDLRHVLKELLEKMKASIRIEEDSFTSGLLSTEIGKISKDSLSTGCIKGTGEKENIRVISKSLNGSIELTIELFGRRTQRTFSKALPSELYATFFLDSLRRELLKEQMNC